MLKPKFQLTILLYSLFTLCFSQNSYTQENNESEKIKKINEIVKNTQAESNEEIPGTPLTKNEEERLKNSLTENGEAIELSESEIKELSKMLEQTQRPSLMTEIKHVVSPSHIGMDMLRFYAVVGMLDYHKCITTRDPSICRGFIESMKDPAHHVGFALFMIGNGMTNIAFLRASKGKVSAGQLGMAIGMMIQDLYTEFFVAGPTAEKVKEVFNTYWNAAKYKDEAQRKETRKAALSEIWKHTFADARWRFDKGVDITSLIAASLASQVTMNALNLGWKLIKWKKHGQQVKMAFRTANGASKVMNFAIQGARVMLKGMARAPIANNPAGIVIKVGSYVLSTGAFLKYAELFESKISDNLRRSYTAKKIIKAEDNLKELLNKNISAEKFESESKKLIEAWDNYRSALLRKPLEVKGRHESELAKFDQTWIKAMNYANWIFEEKADKSSLIWDKNLGKWHTSIPQGGNWVKDAIANYKKRKLNKEILKYSDSLFCGGNPLEAVVVSDNFEESAYLPIRNAKVEPIAMFSPLISGDLCPDFPEYKKKYQVERAKYEKILSEVPDSRHTRQTQLELWDKEWKLGLSYLLHDKRVYFLSSLSDKDRESLKEQLQKSLVAAYTKYVNHRFEMEQVYNRVITAEMIKSYTGKDVTIIDEDRNEVYASFLDERKKTTQIDATYQVNNFFAIQDIDEKEEKPFLKEVFYTDEFKDLLNFETKRQPRLSYVTENEVSKKNYTMSESVSNANMTYAPTIRKYTTKVLPHGMLPSYESEIEVWEEFSKLTDNFSIKKKIDEIIGQIELKSAVADDMLTWFQLPVEMKAMINPIDELDYSDDESYEEAKNEVEFLRTFYLSY